MIKLVVFDLDGTLVDSVEDLATAVNVGLEEMGYPLRTLEEYRRFVGNGALKLCERALPDDAKDRAEELRKKFSAYYGEHATVHTQPYDGMEDVLAELKKSGIKLAVASNKPQNFSIDIVRHFFGDTVDIIFGNIEQRPKKPAPDIIYDIMNELGISADETMMVGDSDVDINTAVNAGIRSIGCTWGYRSRKILEEKGADFIAEYPQDIVKIIINK